MQVVITAVGPDHRGLADPIVHYVTGAGANIHEIQMYDRDAERLFAFTGPHLPRGWSAVFPTAIERGTAVRVR